jgi:voltage-gated potassium channel
VVWKWVINRGLARPFVAVVLTSTAVILTAGAGFAAFDRAAVGSYAEGVWWALSLATTVGFAGQAPTTTAGYVLSAAVMLVGFWLLTLTTAAIASLFVREEEEPAQETEIALEVEILTRLDEVSRRLEEIERQLAVRGVVPPEPGSR